MQSEITPKSTKTIIVPYKETYSPQYISELPHSAFGAAKCKLNFYLYHILPKPNLFQKLNLGSYKKLKSQRTSKWIVFICLIKRIQKLIYRVA